MPSSESYTLSASNDGSDPAPPSPALSPIPVSMPNLGPVSLLSENLVLGNHNATLTSFAHLAALRLNVDRVLISVSDRTSQFILAQSTQSCSQTNYEATGNGVWGGCSSVSCSAWQMCKSTLDLPPSNRESGQYHFMVLNDLSKDVRYKNLPFVQGEPHFRFYAGTPLTTATNINIGCFFLFDTKPRQGLSDEEKQTMGSLGMLVMDYLRVSRQASEGRRASRLSHGLSCFVEGSSSLVDMAHPSHDGACAPGTPPSYARGNHLSVGSTNSFDFPSRRSPSTDTRSFTSTSEYKTDQCSPAPDSALPEWWSGSRQKGQENSHDHHWAFRRAANLLRESLELDAEGGVMFLEASNSPMLNDFEIGSDYSGYGETNNPAPVLAISTNEDPFAPRPGSMMLYPATNLDGGFLRQLLRRYSKGKLWSFHRDGVVSSSDDENHCRYRSRPPELGKGGGGKKWKTFENSMLNLYFPNATQVIFVPLWNAANSQWFGGCFCWTTEETRVFNASVELSSILGFGSSVMVECNRVESLISDRQKGDFIGSISPLHGILAAVEFLSETQFDEFQESLLETINACGRTLLDTMNQVLDFSKIVSLEKTWRDTRRGRTAPDAKPLEKLSAHLDTNMATDIALLAEEVVEGVCVGHFYGQKSTAAHDQYVLPANAAAAQTNLPKGAAAQLRSEVEVVVDIVPNDWVYMAQPGALRRIIMNIFGNAMKYTESGRITLRMDVTELSDNRARRHGAEDLVTFTVSDTGKGISEEFLRGRLYTPFAQEDTLAVGTGLGLSIVRSLVRSLHGSINVHSQPGEGTVVKVTLPLLRLQTEVSVDDAIDPRALSPREVAEIGENAALRESHRGRRAAILGFERAAAEQHPFWSVISRYLTDWYGLELVSWPSPTPVDLVLTNELGLTSGMQHSLRRLHSTIPSLLIICNQSIDQTARVEFGMLASRVKIIHRPCGPQKLAQLVRRCLDEQQGSKTATPQKILLPERPYPRILVGSESTPAASEMQESKAVVDIWDTATDVMPDTVSSGASSSSLGVQTPAAEIEQSPLATIVTPPSPVQPCSRAVVPGVPDEKTPVPPMPRRARILVVDDNSINLNLMLMFLKRRNLHTLDSADNGKSAVDAVERMLPGYDIIFMATRAIRSLEKERDGESAIIIALTGLSSSHDETEALAAGVDLFLTKPVSFKEVSRLLAKWENGLVDQMG
ncbi:hypothetical protein EYZ11_006757 [Aspergillus tanneri]|uniref:histidine kinase n=1 Tax=Aspergillus tanneri TaxID=1220188 RepID=A0A4S3JF22_9EURO|nr:hypothetical protein EYZ11_006757 [Aspergillus tanneri]